MGGAPPKNAYCAGKTTTMRMIVGLDARTRGWVTVACRRYRDLPALMREVGA